MIWKIGFLVALSGSSFIAMLVRYKHQRERLHLYEEAMHELDEMKQWGA